MAPPWRTNSKDISRIGQSSVPAGIGPLLKNFSPPPIPQTLSFHPAALYGAMARTAALRSTSTTIQQALTTSFTALGEQVIDDNGKHFEVVQDVEHLVDFERTALSGRIGSAFADLIMNALGYTWRDLAKPANTGLAAPLGDFIYLGTPCGQDVVLTEAKGSLASGVTAASVAKTAKGGYTRQVAPHIGRPTSFGNIVHGYAVAFGAVPGGHGVDVHVVETDWSGHSAGGVAQGSASPIVSMALATYRAAFGLASAPAVVDAIEQYLAGRRSEGAQWFRRFRSGSDTFLVGADPVFEGAATVLATPGMGPFGIREDIAQFFLETLSRLLAAPPTPDKRIDLLQAPLRIAPPHHDHVLFRDGTAVLLNSSTESASVRYRVWSPRTGLSRSLSSGPRRVTVRL